MITVHKYPFQLAGSQRVSMPAGAVLLTVQIHEERAVLWAKVEADSQMATRLLHIRGAGQAIDWPWLWIAACQDPQTGLVWHVFDGGWE